MKKPALIGLAAVLSAALPVSPALATPPPIMGTATAAPPATATGSVKVTALDGTVTTLTAADIAGMGAEHVKVTHDGQTIDYAGPLLSEILRGIDAPMGPRIHGPGVNDVVVVTGADGFRATLTLAEVDPDFHDGAKVILADRADGQPIAGKAGPYRLVVAGDRRRARSVYAVVSIALKHLS